LIDAILFRIRLDIDDLMEELPPNTPPRVREALQKEMLPHSEHVLGSLTTDELQNERALQAHLESVAASTRYLINRIKEQRSRYGE